MGRVLILVGLALFLVVSVVAMFAAQAAGAGFAVGVSLGGGFALAVLAFWYVVFEIIDR